MEESNKEINLSTYRGILKKKHIPGYIQCKHTPVSFTNNDTNEDLWRKHDLAIKNKKISEKEPKKSLLDLKIELASRIFQQCCFCERKCLVDRRKQSGKCKVKKSQIASEFLHYGEEKILIPSYTIFFSGCTFKCVFCQNWDTSQQSCGIYIDPSVLSKLIEKRTLQNAINVNWVGGDPTPNLLYILKTLKISKENISQIWNSNMFCSMETMRLLSGVIDLYLTDFKYGNDTCAKRLSEVDNYLKIIQRNHIIAHKNGDLIIRHLVMPNHVECCSKPILKWIADNLPNSVVNIMDQYQPNYKAINFKEIYEPVKFEELSKVKEYASQLGICEI